MSKVGLPKNKRIRRHKDYLKIGRYGSRFRAPHIVMIAARAPKNRAGQFGFTVSKQVGKAHERNLIKRRLKHIARLNQEPLAAYDVVLIAQNNAQSASFDDLTQEFLVLSTKAVRFFDNKSKPISRPYNKNG